MGSAIERLRVFYEEQKAAGVSQTALAKRLDMLQPKLSRVLAGTIGVTLDDALAIEAATADWVGGPILVHEWQGYAPRAANGEACR